MEPREPAMSLDADQIVDRRRMRRKLTFWRVLTVLVAVVAVIVAGMMVTDSGPRGSGHSIARINIEGLIRSNQQRVEALERLSKSNAPAVIVHLPSPGGTD